MDMLLEISYFETFIFFQQNVNVSGQYDIIKNYKYMIITNNAL